MRAHLPAGTLIAIAGARDLTDPGAVLRRLDQTRAKYDDLVLVHGGGPGADRLAAPFRRNDELLALLPRDLIAFEGGGITANLVDKAKALGIPVLHA